MKLSCQTILLLSLMTVPLHAEDMNRASDINKCRDVATGHIEYKAMPCTGNTQVEPIEVYGGIARDQQKVYEAGLEYSRERESRQPQGNVSIDPAGYQQRLDAKNQQKRASIGGGVSGGSSSSAAGGGGDFTPRGDRNPTGSRNEPRGVRNYQQ